MYKQTCNVHWCIYRCAVNAIWKYLGEGKSLLNWSSAFYSYLHPRTHAHTQRSYTKCSDTEAPRDKCKTTYNMQEVYIMMLDQNTQDMWAQGERLHFYSEHMM